MRISGSIAVAMVVGVSLAVVGAQNAPGPPTNLRIVSGTAGARGAVASRSHEYFNSLVALPQHFRSWSLRDQAQLDGLLRTGTSRYFTYVFGSDSYSDPQDAAKFYKPVDDQIGTRSDSIPGNQQLRMPMGIPYSSGDSILVIWDWYYGREFRSCLGEIRNYKIFNIRSSTGSSNSGNIYLGTKIAFRDAEGSPEPNAVGTHYNALVSSKDRTGIPTGMLESDTTRPTGAGAVPNRRYQLRWGQWTRYIMEIRLNVSGSDPGFDDWKSIDSSLDYREFNKKNWNMISQWVLDEERDAVRLLYRLPWNMDQTHLAYFNYEFNTSQRPPGQTCAFVGYGRNAIVLRNYAINVAESDTRIFKRPVR